MRLTLKTPLPDVEEGNTGHSQGETCQVSGTIGGIIG